MVENSFSLSLSHKFQICSVMEESTEYQPLMEDEIEIHEFIKVKKYKNSNYFRLFSLLIIVSILGFLISAAFEHYKVDIQQHASESLKDLTALIPSIKQENLADYLYNTTRVLCVVMTTKSNYIQRGSNISDTWGKRCNKLLFFSDEVGMKSFFKLKL